ncbi:response regulator [Patulibacter sp. SYSU D01012]|uniref:response regulator n=1 Tax=Patulibacter sp. SYSU D01012 TaxID=2817381 RepID=UPI001B30B329|nr:response regulator [Patulibacter sp. SYSU D01012]
MIDVLVVDDDFRVAAVHAEHVGRVPGLRVVAQAHGAAAALDAAARHRPGLVLLDRYLPDADGIDVLRRLRAQAAPPDVLMLTAARDRPSVAAALRAGALHYLLKPVDFAALRAHLAAYVRLQAALDGRGDLDQRAIDRLVALRAGDDRAPRRDGDGDLPPTARRILDALTAAADALSAAGVAEAVGISRATAQRHLSALARDGAVALDLRYGATGRPEHLYRPAAGPDDGGAARPG